MAGIFGVARQQGLGRWRALQDLEVGTKCGESSCSSSHVNKLESAVAAAVTSNFFQWKSQAPIITCIAYLSTWSCWLHSDSRAPSLAAPDFHHSDTPAVYRFYAPL